MRIVGKKVFYLYGKYPLYYYFVLLIDIMKNSYRPIVLITLLTVSIALSAQESPFSFGVKAGFNVSNTSLNEDDFTDIKTKEPHIGFVLGVTADYDFTKSFGIRSGLEYTVKGVKLKGFTNWIPSGKEYWDERYSLGYLQLPLLAVYRYNISDDLNVFINVGPYFAYGVGGKVTVRTRYYDLGDEPDEKKKVDSFGDDALKRFDWGLIGGIGAELNRISISFNYEFGLTDPADGRDIIYTDAEFNNRNASISIGYRF